MLPERIYLIDRDAQLVTAWREVFRGYPEVTVERGDFFERHADAMVSPGNSFGVMDGELDAAIRDVLGRSIEVAVRKRLVERHHGELHVGCGAPPQMRIAYQQVREPPDLPKAGR